MSQSPTNYYAFKQSLILQQLYALIASSKTKNFLNPYDNASN